MYYIVILDASTILYSVADATIKPTTVSIDSNEREQLCDDLVEQVSMVWWCSKFSIIDANGLVITASVGRFERNLLYMCYVFYN